MCEDVLRESPSAVAPLHTMGLTLEMLGRAGEAAYALHKAAVMTSSLDPGVWIKVARLHHASCGFDKELKALKRAVALRPGDPVLLADTAECYNGLGMHRHEVRALEKCITACASACAAVLATRQRAGAAPVPALEEMGADIVASVASCTNDLIATGEASPAPSGMRAHLMLVIFTKFGVGASRAPVYFVRE